jgi:branched-chain amino acid aminotransferase
MAWFNYNGKMYQEEAPAISVNNRGLRYGDGLFETMKLLNGRLVLADEHFARLWKGMQVLQFNLPKHFNPDLLQQEVLALAKKNAQGSNLRVRITVIRGAGGLYDAINHLPHYIIETMPLPQGNGEWNANGLVLGIYGEVQKSCDILSNLKHNNYLLYVMAALEAKKQQWNDALVLNTHGRICDSTIANIFYIKEGVVYTPPLNEGGVAGVLRRQVISQLAAAAIPFMEKAVGVEELLQAEEVFLTNSIYNIRWVQRIGDAEFGNELTQKIYTIVLPTIS